MWHNTARIAKNGIKMSLSILFKTILSTYVLTRIYVPIELWIEGKALKTIYN